MFSSRTFQLIGFAACFFLTFSLALNIVALCMISEVKEKVESLYHNSRKSFNEQEKKILGSAYNASKNLNLYKKEIRKNFDSAHKQLKSIESNIKELEKELHKSKKRIRHLEEKLKLEWKKGCPSNGITNGTLCYVLNKEKVNFTTASESCRNQGGFLARIPNLQVLKSITDIFSKAPFFVDGFYNRSSEKWLTSDREKAINLPWKLDQPQPEGDCVYAYRSGYKSWHCNALFEYLCEFG